MTVSHCAVIFPALPGNLALIQNALLVKDLAATYFYPVPKFLGGQNNYAYLPRKQVTAAGYKTNRPDRAGRTRPSPYLAEGRGGCRAAQQWAVLP